MLAFFKKQMEMPHSPSATYCELEIPDTFGPSLLGAAAPDGQNAAIDLMAAENPL